MTRSDSLRRGTAPSHNGGESDRATGHGILPPRHRQRSRPHRRLHRAILPGDDVDIDVAAAPYERIDERADEPPPPGAARRLADHDLAHVAVVRVAQDGLADGLAAEVTGCAPSESASRKRLDDPVRTVSRAGAARRLDVGRDPSAPRRSAIRLAPAPCGSTRRWTDTDEHALSRAIRSRPCWLR